ncbi:MAG TPA: ABC transporter ATP-binding protein [Burkholderiales bacterium]
MPLLLKVRGLTRKFGGVFANNDISFDVAAGSVVGLIGPNGAGKTTVFNLITGFLTPDAGEVRFEDRDITGKRPDLLSRRGIARTFQVLRPFPRLTVEENVMVGPIARGESMAAARQRAGECLELVGIRHKAKDLARGLSTGQRKRLEMARAMATQPRLLLLDEITGGVDQPSIPGLIALVARLREEGVTLLVIEHNMRVIMELAEKVVFLHLGEKVAEGAPAEIARHPRVVELYLGSHA